MALPHPHFHGNLSILFFIKTQLHFHQIIPQTCIKSRFPHEKRGGFHMHRPGEQIYARHPLHFIPSSLQHFQIPCKACRLAGNVYHALHAKTYYPLKGFRAHAISWRVKHDQVRQGSERWSRSRCTDRRSLCLSYLRYTPSPSRKELPPQASLSGKMRTA